MASESVPVVFSRPADGNRRSLRLLDGFTLHVAGQPDALVALDALRDRQQQQHGAPLVASGELLQPTHAGPCLPAGGAGAAKFPVTTGPVLDWCLEYGEQPAVWIITDVAWYRLMSPSKSYSTMYAAVQARFDLAVRCRTALCQQPYSPAEAVQACVLTGQHMGGSSSKGYSMQQLQAEAPFLAGQMKSLQQSGVFTRPAPPGVTAGSMPFLDWLLNVAAHATAGANGDADGPAAKRRRISEQSVTQGTASGPGAAAPAASAGGVKPGSKLKIKFKLSHAAAEPPADRSSLVQGDGPGQLQHQPSLPVSQMTAATTGQSQRVPALKTKIKFTLPKGPRPSGSPASAPAAAAGSTFAQTPAVAVNPMQAPQDAPAGVPPWEQPYSQQQPQQQWSAAGAARQAASSARAAAASNRVSEAQQRKAARAREAQLKLEAEARADAARGPPPPPSRSFRLPAWAMADVLTLWELCQCFAAALQVPSFSCEMLEAALLPGPLDAEEKATTAVAVSAAADSEAAAARAALMAAAATAAAAAAPIPQQDQQQQAAVKAEPLQAETSLQQPQQDVPGQQGSTHGQPQPPGDEAKQEQLQQADSEAKQEPLQQAGGVKQEQLQPTVGDVKQDQEQLQPAVDDAKEQQQPAVGEVKQEAQPDGHGQSAASGELAVLAGAASEAQPQQLTHTEQQETQQQQQQQQQQPTDGMKQSADVDAAIVNTCAAAGVQGAADTMGPSAQQQPAAAEAEPQPMQLDNEVQQQPQQQQQQELSAKPMSPPAVVAAAAAAAPAPAPAQAPAPAAAAAAAGVGDGPKVSTSACTAPSAQPTASNSLCTGASPGKSLKIKVKLGKVNQPAVQAAAGAAGGAAAAAAAGAGAGLDPAAAAALGVPAAAAAACEASHNTTGMAPAAAGAHPAAAQPEQASQQQLDQGGTAWMAQAHTAAIAAAAAVSSAIIEGKDADDKSLQDNADGQAAGYDEVGITDGACLPSSLLLRDIHLGLLRLMDGSGPKTGKRGLKPPATARLCPTDSQRQLQVLMSLPHWSLRAAQVVKASGAVVTGPHPQEAAKQLLQSDYALLSLEPRLALLRCLTDFAFASELARAHLDARNEAFAQSRALGKPGFATNTFSVMQGPTGALHSSWGLQASKHTSPEQAAEHATGVKMLEEWVEWVEMQSHQAALCTDPIPTMGLRRPLGTDARRRRYWVLGGASGAWRVFCEEADSRNWGFYEGTQLMDLLAWLAAGAIEAEATLLANLCSMPWPYRPSLVVKAAKAAATAAAASAGVPEPHSPTSFSYWAGFASGRGPGGSSAGALGQYGAGAGLSGGLAAGVTPVEAGVQPAGTMLPLGLQLPHERQLMAPGEMQRHRPNGYLGFMAPALYGEAEVPGGSILSTTDERLRCGFDSLLAQVPFWLAGQADVVQHLVTALEQLQAEHSAAAYSQALLNLAAAMSSSTLQPHSPLDEDWHKTWQQQWKHSLGQCQPPSWEAMALHLSMLGRHVVPRPFRMTRDAFLSALEGSRCKLTMPAVGQVVCLVRSGCLLHLKRYAQLPDYATAPLPPPAAELNAAAEVVKKLPPVARYRVMALSYCQYPVPQPPPVQQQSQLEPAPAVPGHPQQQQGADGTTAVQQVDQQGHQQQQQAAKGSSKSGSSKKKAKSYSAWGFDEDDDEEERSGDEEADEESETNSEDDAFNDRNIRLTGIDSDAEGLASGSQPQQQSASQSLQQQSQQQQQQSQPSQQNGDASQPLAGQQPPPQQQQQQPVVPVQQRPPCMWVLLAPVNTDSSAGSAQRAPSSAPADLPPPVDPELQLDDPLGDDLMLALPQQQQSQQQKLPCLAVPLHIDSDMPDYLVQPPVFEAALQRRWLPQDRCSMFIGSRQRGVTSIASGEYAQGTIIEIEEPLPGEEYNPWQSITVLWDDEWSDLNLRSKVSPWDVDTDYEERLRQEEEAKKAAAAAAAAEELARQEAAAEAARQKRRQNQRARLDQIGDLGVGAAERDDDDDYNPEDDSSDSEGGRKNRKSKLAKLQHQQSLSLMPQQAQHAFGESRGGRRGRGAGGRGRGTGLTWSGGGRGGRAGGAMGPAGGIMPLHAGHAWTRVQIEQQQSMHLNSLQQSMATAMATGNTALLAQLASGAAGNQVLPPPLPLDLLSDLPAQMEFLILVAAYNNSHKPGFVPPAVNGRELDLYTLFLVVNVRGGYEAVCTSCRWPDVCRSLGCDQTQASVNAMRSSYERSLLEFEQYARSGRYKRDRELNEAPQWQQAHTDAAIEQAMRAGKAAVAAAGQPAATSLAPRGATGAGGPRGALPLLPGAAGAAAGLMALPGGLQGVQLMQSNQVALAQAQLAAQLRLQQQAQLLAAQKAGRPAGGAGVRPVQAAQAVNAAAVQQQLILQQQALQRQLLQANAGNPQLQALLLQQQQQAQLAAAGRPLGTPSVTMAQLQQLQLQRAASLQQASATAAAAAAGSTPAVASQGQPATSQPLAQQGSVNFSALLDGS